MTCGGAGSGTNTEHLDPGSVLGAGVAGSGATIDVQQVWGGVVLLQGGEGVESGYQVCWCSVRVAPNGCAEDADFDVVAGEFDVRGGVGFTNHQDADLLPVSGVAFTVKVVGVDLGEVGDRISIIPESVACGTADSLTPIPDFVSQALLTDETNGHVNVA